MKIIINTLIVSVLGTVALTAYGPLVSYAENVVHEVNAGTTNLVNQVNGALPGGAATVQLVQTNTVSDLGPGGSALPVVGTVTVNGSAYINTITTTVTGTSDPGCTPADFTTTPYTLDKTVSGTLTGVSFGTIEMNADAPGNCASVSVSFAFTSN